jgi:hypothetical protein
VTHGRHSDLVFGHHEPDDGFVIASELGITAFDPTPRM